MTPKREKLEAAISDALGQRDFGAAATLIIEGYGPELLGFLMNRLRHEDVASEAFSAFAEDLWNGLPRFEQRASARVWSYALATNAANRTAKATQRRRGAPLDPNLVDLEARVRTETLTYLRTEARNSVAALRERLPQEDQTLLVLRVNRGLDWKEIALVSLYRGEDPDPEAIGREAARLRKRFQLVKDRLRRMAKEAGLLSDR